MSRLAFTLLARDDIQGITEFTIETWGWRQAETYVDGLEALLLKLCDAPTLGRSVPEIASGWRRFDYQSHMIFYRPADFGLVVARILHQRMDVARHIDDDTRAEVERLSDGDPAS